MKDNIVKEKSFTFAVRVVRAYQVLSVERKEFVISKQFLRCGTSIGANIEEAIGAQSKADFISKLSIAYKEARETHYWIRLLKETGYLSESEANNLLCDVEELLKIIARIKMTAIESINNS